MRQFDPLVTDGDGGGNPVIVWANVSITRRKSFYVVTGADGETAYRNRHFWPCIEYLESQGIKAYEIRASEPPKRSRVAAIKVSEGILTWQN